MAVESPVQQGAATKTFPYGLLRAGFPYFATIGMRRVTTAAADVPAKESPIATPYSHKGKLVSNAVGNEPK